MRKIVEAVSTAAKRHLADEGGLAKLPHLADFLAATHYDGGEDADARAPGTIYLSIWAGKIQVTLKEPTQQMVCRVLVDKISDVWPQIDAILGDPNVSLWQKDAWAKSGKKK